MNKSNFPSKHLLKVESRDNEPFIFDEKVLSITNFNWFYDCTFFSFFISIVKANERFIQFMNLLCWYFQIDAIKSILIAYQIRLATLSFMSKWLLKCKYKANEWRMRIEHHKSHSFPNICVKCKKFACSCYSIVMSCRISALIITTITTVNIH